MEKQFMDVQAKVEQLQDAPQIDTNIPLHLWKEIIHLRQQYVRNWSAVKICKEFSGYLNRLNVSLFGTNC